ncbi:BMP and activin membrane-bound inhibitor [Caerostris darwini]|uniref:BMP and activin membrane-bound inhibitor n=1 Tax=Caerostris darwini TaxID=1538125 RepID=A0AAV4QAX1_9ARAC|nr:BMP and activin membrane-bound inhibitor [Caerostris darwini]
MTGRMDIVPFELLLIFICFQSSVKGEIRCYCNQASCVSTGYMCKSRTFCFSDLESGLHGCLGRRKCLGLQCCTEDMCNYIHVDLSKHPWETSVSVSSEEDSPDISDQIALIESAIRREMNYKIGMILAPIVGLLILAVLIVFATRWLRQDMESRRRLSELRGNFGGHSLKDTLLPWNLEKNTAIV